MAPVADAAESGRPSSGFNPTLRAAIVEAFARALVDDLRGHTDSVVRADAIPAIGSPPPWNTASS